MNNTRAIYLTATAGINFCQHFLAYTFNILNIFTQSIFSTYSIAEIFTKLSLLLHQSRKCLDQCFHHCLKFFTAAEIISSNRCLSVNVAIHSSKLAKDLWLGKAFTPPTT